MTTISTDRPHRPLLTPHEDSVLAFARAMEAWELSLNRPDMEERDRMAGALLAYQSQLDACIIAGQRFGDHVAGSEKPPHPDGIASLLPPLIQKGDRVVTRKGAKFRGVAVVVYDSLKGVPHAVVESDHPHFDGTEHLYPLAQLVHDPLESRSGRP